MTNSLAPDGHPYELPVGTVVVPGAAWPPTWSPARRDRVPRGTVVGAFDPADEERGTRNGMVGVAWWNGTGRTSWECRCLLSVSPARDSVTA